MLSDCAIGDEGCLALMRPGLLASIAFLTLDDNGLSDDEATAILEGLPAGQLTDLTMNDDGISDGLVLRLRRRFKGVLFFSRASVPDEDG